MVINYPDWVVKGEKHKELSFIPIKTQNFGRDTLSITKYLMAYTLTKWPKSIDIERAVTWALNNKEEYYV